MISRAYTSWCMIGTFETYIFFLSDDPRDRIAIMWLFCGRQIIWRTKTPEAARIAIVCRDGCKATGAMGVNYWKNTEAVDE